MKIKTVIASLAAEYPPQMAMSWDNPGVQVGRTDRFVQKVYVALDATEEVIRDCVSWGAQLLVTHHPLLMSGIRRVSDNDFLGRKILEMAENGITHYAMHTNYDVVKMAQLAETTLSLNETKILEVTGTREDGSAYGIGSVGTLPRRMTASECCAHVKKTFGLESVRLFGDPKREVTRMAVSPGSGKSMVAPAIISGAEILVTGDIGHHDGLDAVDQGMLVMDAGHYGIEHIFVRQMADYLKTEFPALEVREAKTGSPFAVL